MRKPNKLPRKTVSVKYDLEYGSNELHMHEDSIKPGQKVLIIDDLLATGGTVEATAKMIEELGGEVVGIVVMIELAGLKGREKLSKYRLELGYYKMLVEDAYPDKTVEYAAIYFTKDGKYSELKFIEEEYSAVNCSVTEYNNKIELIEKVREKIEAGEFPPKRQYLCQYCDFKDHCDEEGFIT